VLDHWKQLFKAIVKLESDQSVFLEQIEVIEIEVEKEN